MERFTQWRWNHLHWHWKLVESLQPFSWGSCCGEWRSCVVSQYDPICRVWYGCVYMLDDQEVHTRRCLNLSSRFEVSSYDCESVTNLLAYEYWLLVLFNALRWQQVLTTVDINFSQFGPGHMELDRHGQTCSFPRTQAGWQGRVPNSWRWSILNRFWYYPFRRANFLRTIKVKHESWSHFGHFV